MFNLIKNIILLGLLIVVVYFGFNIYSSSNEIIPDRTEEKVQIKKSIDKLKQLAQEKASSIKDIINENTEYPAQTSKQEQEHDAGDDTRKVPSEDPVQKNPKETHINPIDEEDRKLTQEIMGHGTSENQDVEYHENTDPESDLKTTEEPITVKKHTDLNRIAEIRELYSKAVELLDWK